MSMPLENHQPHLPDDDRLIDRLVDGELPDALRRELLLRLEGEPDGWRRCALAFLEAQTWREALGPLAAPAPAVVRPAAVSAGPARKANPWRPVARWAGLAASLAAAFALGWTLHPGPAGTAPHPPVAKGEASAPAAPPEPPRPAPADLAAQEAKPAGPAGVFAPVVKRWEQQGYRAETHKRLVSMELKDGRKLDVPVHEVRLRYVGGRTY
jgi:hypothetical protein